MSLSHGIRKSTFLLCRLWLMVLLTVFNTSVPDVLPSGQCIKVSRQKTMLMSVTDQCQQMVAFMWKHHKRFVDWRLQVFAYDWLISPNKDEASFSLPKLMVWWSNWYDQLLLNLSLSHNIRLLLCRLSPLVLLVYSEVFKSDGFKKQNFIKLEIVELKMNIKHIVSMVNLYCNNV